MRFTAEVQKEREEFVKSRFRRYPTATHEEVNAALIAKHTYGMSPTVLKRLGREALKGFSSGKASKKKKRKKNGARDSSYDPRADALLYQQVETAVRDFAKNLPSSIPGELKVSIIVDENGKVEFEHEMVVRKTVSGKGSFSV